MGRSPGPVGARLARLLLVTAGATYVLVLLGVYTAAEGAGLTCAGRWPLCDGAVFGLFPANWPSFIEWFHRLVAMVTGLLILASAVAAWRGRAPRRVVGALGLAVVLLPLQIWAGAQTVLTYEMVILTAHFLIALVIYTTLLVATIWAVAPPIISRRTLLGGLSGAVIATIPFVLLGPRVLFVHTGGVQVTYYALGLLVLTAVSMTAVLVHRVSTVPPFTRWSVTAIGGVTAVAVGLKLLAGRLVYDATVQLVDWLAIALLVVGIGAMVAMLAPGRSAPWRSAPVRTEESGSAGHDR